MIYFTADTHFYHSNIIHLNNRPFNNVEEMNRSLINNWNAYVTDRDDIYILGDLIYKATAQETNDILKKLKGKKHLIRGNHDKYLNDADFNASSFEWIKDYYVLNYNKRNFVLFHYPILEWQDFFSNAIHLYGHVHNSGNNLEQLERLDVLGKRAMNVGVDVNNFFPVSIDSVIKICD